MNPRAIVTISLLAAAAIGSWYLARPAKVDPTTTNSRGGEHRGYYIKEARILGTDEDGELLYEIEAAYAEQMKSGDIEFTDVRVRYAASSNVQWTINADTAIVNDADESITLRGDVFAESPGRVSDQTTQIHTQFLRFDPNLFIAQTDARVQIQFGPRSLTATGMFASLSDDKIELKSNVRGRIEP